DDAPLDVLLRVRTRVALDEMDPFDDGGSLPRHDAQHASLLPAVLARDDEDGVVLPHVRSAHGGPDGPRGRHYSTSGASEMIFMNFFSRSSRATGPNTRVPTGSFASLIRTAAFLSNRMYEPSRRRKALFVRTITALTTCPFFTVPSGVASLTE